MCASDKINGFYRLNRSLKVFFRFFDESDGHAPDFSEWVDPSKKKVV